MSWCSMADVGSTLLLCGWKTDEMVLLDQTRTMARIERKNFYGKWHTSNGENNKIPVQHDDDYGRFLAHKCVSYMAQCAAGTRPIPSMCWITIGHGNGELVVSRCYRCIRLSSSCLGDWMTIKFLVGVAWKWQSWSLNHNG